MKKTVNLSKDNPLIGLLHGLKAKEPPIVGIDTNGNEPFLPMRKVTQNYCNSKFIYEKASEGLLTLYRLGKTTFVSADELFSLLKEVPSEDLRNKV